MSSPPNSVPEPVVGAAMSHSLKGYTFAADDTRSSEVPANSSALTNPNIKRYSRSELYLIRNGNRSSRRPECALRAELQSLGVWKFNTGPPHQNGNNVLGDGGVLVSNHSSLGAGLSVGGHLSVRSQRSPAARDHPSITASSITASNHSMLHHAAQKTYIDHRSISSSHLMPAFAKRRIAATTAATSSTASNSASPSTYGGNSPGDGRACTPTDAKDGLLRNVGSAGSSNLRQRGEYRPRANASDEHSGFQSPQRKVLSSSEFERDRERQRDREHEYHASGGNSSAAGSRLLSPLTVTNARHGGHGSIMHERRIGSGRLLARDVSWDYRGGGQDKEKSQPLNVLTAAADKDSLTSSHLLQQRSRHADKLHEHGNSGYAERRSYDRRSAGDDSLRDKYENLNASTVNNGRRFAYNDAYGSDSTVAGQQQSVSHGRSRRGHQYNDRNEEPEWFSGGPTSQNDTIELRGFEEIDEPYNATSKRSSQLSSTRKLSESSSSRASSTLNLSNQKSKEQPQNSKDCNEQKTEANPNASPNVSASSDEGTEVVAADVDQSGNESHTNGSSGQSNSTKNKTNGIEPAAPSRKVLPNFMIENTEKNHNNASGSDNNNSLKFTTKDSDFNFDAFLNPNVDPLEHTLMCGDVYSGNDSETIGSSRFSRWFGNTAKMSELQPLKDDGDSIGTVTGSDNTNLEGTNQLQNNAMSFMEFLQRSKLSAASDICLPPKAAIPSVGELEARMRKIDCNNELPTEPINANALAKLSKDHDNQLLNNTLETDLSISTQSPQQTSQPQAREMEAFKKLLEQLGSGNKQQPPTQQSQSPSQTSVPSTTYVSISMMLPQQQQQQNRSGASQPVNMLQVGGGSGVPTTHLPQPPSMLLKTEEFKKFLQHQHTMIGQQQQHQKQLQTALTLPPHILQHNQQLPPPMSPQNIVQSGLNDLTTGMQLPQHSQQPPPLHMPLVFASQPQKRIEVQQLLQWVSRGEISLNFLEQELNNPNTTPHAKEVISAVLRESSRSVTPSTGLNTNMPPPPLQTQSLANIGAAVAAMQQQQNQHQRLQSPIPLGGNVSGANSQCPSTSGACSALQQQTCLSTNNMMPVSCNTQNSNGNVLLPGQPDQRIQLSASGQSSVGNQGLPSQREFQYHTQAIMQNAMFKKKLEEQQQQQQESLKRRQEMQKQHQQQQANIVIGSVSLNEIDMQSKNLQQLHISTSLSMQQQQPAPAGVQQVHVSHGLQQQPHQYQQHLQQRRINSPTPLAFTPTSVLRKMTADKDNSNTNVSHQQLQQNSAVGVTLQQQSKGLIPAVFANVQQQQLLQQQLPSSQPRMILGGNHSQQQTQANSGGPPQISPQPMPSQLPPPQQQQQQQQQPPALQQMRTVPPQMKWPGHLMNQQTLASVSKPMGRPILKGPIPANMQTPQQQQQQSPQPPIQQQMSQLSQLGFPAKLEFQQMQQQRLKNNNQAAQQMITQASPQPFPHTLQSQQQQKPTPQTHNVMTHVQQQQQLFHQHQQRALALQRQQLQLQQQQIQHHHHQQQQQQQQQQHQPLDTVNRNMVLSLPPSISDNSVGVQTNNPTAGIINYQRDGALSPTSNQLAQWFSPELLAQASAGKLPLLNMNQTLSLEEFERNIQHSSTAVHN